MENAGEMLAPTGAVEDQAGKHFVRLVLRPHYDHSNGRPIKLGRFAAYLGTERLCISHQPLLDAARELLNRGHPATALLTTRHEGNDYDNFVPAPIGDLAQLTTAERERGGAAFQKYAPRPPVAGSPMRNSPSDVPNQPDTEIALYGETSTIRAPKIDGRGAGRSDRWLTVQSG
jgi:hypothetical protein